MGWLSWFLAIALALFAGFRLYLAYARNRAREGALQLWIDLEKQGAFDEFPHPDKDTVLETFLIRDAINPLVFFANYASLSPRTAFEALPVQPTPSAVAFKQGLNAPLGYPRWFLAAYPDVVLWLANSDQRTMLRTIATVYGAEKASQLTQVHGIEKAMEMIERDLHDDDKRFKTPYLRRLVDLYRSGSNRSLECSL